MHISVIMQQRAICISPQPEHRSWQQLQWQYNRQGSVWIPRVRFEQRFRRKILDDSTLADGYRFNYRCVFMSLMRSFLARKN